MFVKLGSHHIKNLNNVDLKVLSLLEFCFKLNLKDLTKVEVTFFGIFHLYEILQLHQIQKETSNLILTRLLS